jgi:hypothetical protein
LYPINISNCTILFLLICRVFIVLYGVLALYYTIVFLKLVKWKVCLKLLYFEQYSFTFHFTKFLSHFLNKLMLNRNYFLILNLVKKSFHLCVYILSRGGLVSIPQCIAVLDHCIDIINSPAQLAQCSLAVVVNTSHKIYRFRKWRIYFAPGMGLKLLFWKQWSTSSDLFLLRPHSLCI